MTGNRWLALLVLALVLQLGVMGSRYWNAPGSPDAAGAGQGDSLLAAATQATALLVSDEYDNETLLARRGKRWVLPELLGLPANTEKVDNLLAILASEQAWPVARSTAARQRFSVADYLYQRKLEISAVNGRTQVIYLGTSPGFRKVHARNDASDNIYSVLLSVHDIPAITGAWLDPRLLQIRTPVGIDADSYSLRFENGSWVSGFGGKPDPAELAALLDTLRSMQVEGVARVDTQRDLMTAEAALELHVRGLAGDVKLELFSFEDKHYILSSEYPLFFRLSRYDFDRLAGIDFSLMSGAGG